MSKNIYKNTKNNIKDFHYDDIAVEIGIYDNNDTLTKEEIIPLGNYLYDPLNSAVLNLIKTTIEAGKESNIPVVMCGEMAGDNSYVRLLMGLGLESFSMHPSAVPEVKNIITSTNAGEIKELSMEIIDVDDNDQKNILLDTLNKKIFN